MPPAKKQPQTRIVLLAPGSTDQAANVQADVVDGGFRFQHDYPDLHVLPGWHVEAGGNRYEVLRVEGRTLHCAKLEVPA